MAVAEHDVEIVAGLGEHTHRFALNLKQPISAEAYDYRAGRRLKEHTHRVAQLVYATSGTMSVTTEHGVFVVPPQRAVWIPPDTPHTIDMLSDVSMRTVYLTRERSNQFRAECCVVAVSGLLQHLILAAVDLPENYRLIGKHKALIVLLLEEIRTLDQIPLHLKDPTDRRLLRITRSLKNNPSDNHSLAHWAMIGRSGY